MEDLTSTWAGWLEKKKGRGGDSFCLAITDFEKRALRDLREQGFAVPATRAVNTSLERAVEPLLVEKAAHPSGCQMVSCTFWHFEHAMAAHLDIHREPA